MVKTAYWRNPFFRRPESQYERMSNAVRFAAGLQPVCLYDMTGRTVANLGLETPYSDIEAFWKEQDFWLSPTESSLDYAAIMESKLQEIVDYAHQANKKLAVWWSGGIDSTAIVCALMKASHADNVVIMLNADSVAEYPALGTRLREQYVCEDSSDFSKYFRSDYVNVDGTYGDVLFGPPVAKNYYDRGLTSTDLTTANVSNVLDLLAIALNSKDLAHRFFDQSDNVLRPKYVVNTVFEFFWLQGLIMNYHDLHLVPYIRTSNIHERSPEELRDCFDRNLPCRVYGSKELLSFSLAYAKLGTDLGARQCSRDYILQSLGDHDYYANKRKEFSQGKIYQNNTVSAVYSDFTFENLTNYRI